MNQIQFVIFLLLASFILALPAQSQPSPSALKFEHLSTAQGLSHSTVNCIVQDHRGFMWFGTFDGLNRYDGNRFAIYKHDPKDLTSLGASGIWALYEDRAGVLWVGTENGGLNRLEAARETFTRYLQIPNDPHSLGGNRVRAILEDRAGRLWIGTLGGGLNLFARESERFTRYQHDAQNPASLSHDAVWCIFEDEQEAGVLWLGTTLGLNRFDQARGTFKHYRQNDNDPNSLSNDMVMAIAEDDDGALWIGTNGGGLNRFDKQREVFTHYVNNPNDARSLSGNVIHAIRKDHRGGLWFGAWGGGLNQLQQGAAPGAAFTFVRHQHALDDPESLSGNHVLPIYEDRQGALWIGTNGNGINRLDRDAKAFARYRHNPNDAHSLGDQSVNAIYEDRAHQLWFGTDSRGLERFERKHGVVARYQHDPRNPRSLSSNAVQAIYADHSGVLWIGTLRGLNKMENDAGTFTRYLYEPQNPQGLPADIVTHLYEDHAGAFWVGTNNGLALMDRERGTFKTYQHAADDATSLSDNNIFMIHENARGEFWVATNRGLNLFDRRTAIARRYQNDPQDSTSLSSNRVLTMYEARNGTLWCGTWGGGLNQLVRAGERLTFRHYRERDGLSNDVIYGILEDEQNRLWLSTNKGLSCFDPATEKFRNYDAHDGLQGDEYNSGAFFKSATSGEMFFGGINGLNVFHPAQVKDNDFVPPVFITSLTRYNKNDAEGKPIFEKGLVGKDAITLSYRDNILVFTFAALSYRNSFKNQYAYRLEGFNADWIALGTKHDVTFTNLDAAEYTLRVKGSNNDGVWNEAGTALKIIITPPWWRTWWAYLFYVLAIAALLYFARRYELHRARLTERLRLEQVEAEKLREIDQMKSRFFTNLSHEFRTPLTLILGQIESVLSTMSDRQSQSKLEIASRNARRLQRLINQLLDLSKLEAGSVALHTERANVVSFLKSLAASFEHMAEHKGITLQLQSTHAEVWLDYDAEKLEKVFYNLLSNAFKFTPAGGEISVQLAVNGEQLPVMSDQPATKSKPLSYQRLTTEHWLLITVKDTGIGIPLEHLPHVFDRFYQADSSQQLEGTGIGLALAKELVELHGGKILVTSSVGKGTAFVGKLPVASVSSDQLTVIGGAKSEELAATGEGREARSADAILQDAKTPSIQQANVPPNQTAGQELVLLVEDNADIRAFVREQLQNSYRVLEAEDGEAAIALARETIPDLIVTDVMMPKLNGYQMSRALKEDERTSHIPIIMLTAKAGLDDKLAGLETGVDDYLLKPFSARELLARVRNLIALRRQLRERFRAATLIKPSEVAATSVDEAFLQRVLAAIEAQMGEENFGVEELARTVNMSSSQLNRKLNALIDQPASQFIRSMRLQRAADLLKQNAGTITEIAYRVGFSDQAHFARSFRKQFGCAPSEFRDKS